LSSKNTGAVDRRTWPNQPHPGHSGWVLTDNLRALIHARGFPSFSAAARAISRHSLSQGGPRMPESQILRYVSGQQPRPETLRRILEGLGATEIDLISARFPDTP
jgi:hypothetical protein